VFENRMQRRIFGYQRNEIIGARENFVMRSFVTVFIAKYNSNDQLKENKIDITCGRHGREKIAYWVLVKISERKRPLGSPKYRSRG
jgi:hypothetical protein